MFNLLKKKVDNSDYSTFFTSKELDAINQLIEDVASTLDLDVVLQKSIDSAVKLLNLHGGILFLKDPTGKFIYTKTMAKSPYSQKALNLLRIDDMMDKLKVSMDQKDNLVVDSIVNDRDNVSNELWKFTIGVLDKNLVAIIQKATMTGNVIVVPIKYRNLIIGGLLLSKRGYRENFDKDLPIIRIYANQIAIAIANASLFEEKSVQIILLEQQNRDLQSLYNLTSNVSKSLDPDVVAQTAVDSLPQDMSMLGAVLGMYDEKKNEIYIKALTQNQWSNSVKKIIGDFSQYTIKLDNDEFKDNISAKAFKFGTIYSSNDIGELISPPVPKQLVGSVSKILNVKSIASFPVTSRGKNVGVITYLLKEKSFDELTESEKQLYTTYTYQIAIALENASLLKNLEEAKNQIEDAYKKEKDMMDILGHELRTPLTIARNAIFMIDMELKKEVPDMDVIKDLMEKSKENIKREVSILQTVLSSTRLENDRAQINYEKVDAKDVINDSIDALEKEAEKKNLELKISLPEKELFVWAGREQMQEIVDNLLSNAIKYTDKGSVTMSLNEDGDMVLFSIQDTGEGIPEAEIPNLGKKFHRINPYVASSKSTDMQIVRPGGTGIGLYVVKGFVKVMGGKLNVESKVGVGSTFTVYIPKYINQDKVSVNSTSQQSVRSG